MPANTPAAHASTLLALPASHPSALLAFWFAGTRESAADVQIADLPAGHWATYATQIAVANNLVTLENGQFMGDRE